MKIKRRDVIPLHVQVEIVADGIRDSQTVRKEC